MFNGDDRIAGKTGEEVFEQVGLPFIPPELRENHGEIEAAKKGALPIGPILAGAGVVGLAVGFGAQSLVRDIIAGFFIILENQVRRGDVAVVNGTGGLVEEINFRTLVLRDLTGTVHSQAQRAHQNPGSPAWCGPARWPAPTRNFRVHQDV